MKLPHETVGGTLLAGIALTVILVIALRAVVQFTAG